MVLCVIAQPVCAMCSAQQLARFVIMEASKLITNIRNRQRLKRLCDTVISCKHFYFQYSLCVLFFFSILLFSLALSKWLIKWQAYVSLMYTIGHVLHHSLRGQLTQGFFRHSFDSNYFTIYFSYEEQKDEKKQQQHRNQQPNVNIQSVR